MQRSAAVPECGAIPNANGVTNVTAVPDCGAIPNANGITNVTAVPDCGAIPNGVTNRAARC